MRGKRIRRYVHEWRKRGYPQDIPDEVPGVLMDQCLAPSYRAVCLAILKNDARLEMLGFQPATSSVHERALKARKRGEPLQLRMFPRLWRPEKSTTLRYKRLDGAEVFEFEP